MCGLELQPGRRRKEVENEKKGREKKWHIKSKYGVQTRSNVSNSFVQNKGPIRKGDKLLELNDCSKYKKTFFVCPESSICTYKSQDITEFRNHVTENHNVIHSCNIEPPNSAYAIYNPFLNEPNNYTIEWHALEMIRKWDQKAKWEN